MLNRVIEQALGRLQTSSVPNVQITISFTKDPLNINISLITMTQVEANIAHNNEIVSIIKERREANIIK